jgi:uncharacterized metal-binding protein YceD (DUF177 family)
MKIEFRKVPHNEKNFKVSLDSVDFEGTFCKISSTLVKIDATLSGNSHITCDRCSKEDDITLNEKLDFLISDGVYKNQTDELVVEIEDGFIDFDEIIHGELSSIQSDYHICDECEQNNKTIEQEF